MGRTCGELDEIELTPHGGEIGPLATGTAVSIGGIDTYNESDPALHDAGNTVADCTVRHVANEWLGTCGTPKGAANPQNERGQVS